MKKTFPLLSSSTELFQNFSSKTFRYLLCLFFFLGSLSSVQAQVFDDFPALLEQLTDEQRAQFLNDLQNIDLDELADLFNNTEALDRLKEVLAGPNPIADLDALFDEWEEGRILLLAILGDSELLPEDQTVLTDEFDRLNLIWNANVTDLSTLFDDFGNNLVIDGTIDGDLLPPSIENLQADLIDAWDNTDPNGIGNLGEVLGELFDQDLFTNLEFAYGRREAQVDFYNSSYQVEMNDLQVIRVGSVPSFDSQWEARWQASASWTGSGVGDVINGEAYPGVPKAFNPFSFDADFAAMYNPGFALGAGSARLITSLGFEVATYAPAHLNPENRITWENVGYTTGYGPQVGMGFAISQGPVTTYVMATTAYGFVEKGEAYTYQSQKVEAGIRYGDAINVRYTTGQQDWAPFGNKKVRTNHQVTVGILLESLFQ